MSRPRITPTSFAERLAYARWVRQLTTSGGEEFDKDLAARVGVTPPWLAKWKGRQDAPPGHKELGALASALGCRMDWLATEAGDPPLPALWRDWLAARQGRPVPLAGVPGGWEMIDPTKDRKLTEDELDQATRDAEGSAESSAAPKRRRKRGA